MTRVTGTSRRAAFIVGSVPGIDRAEVVRQENPSEAIAVDDELFCSECDDWRPADDIEHCDGCDLDFCHEHRHQEDCRGGGTT